MVLSPPGSYGINQPSKNYPLSQITFSDKPHSTSHHTYLNLWNLFSTLLPGARPITNCHGKLWSVQSIWVAHTTGLIPILHRFPTLPFFLPQSSWQGKILHPSMLPGFSSWFIHSRSYSGVPAKCLTWAIWAVCYSITASIGSWPCIVARPHIPFPYTTVGQSASVIYPWPRSVNWQRGYIPFTYCS